MKPIRLDIAGLQSYREAQTVDFDLLCQGGVFGIFGPTGSGKSSILDAMTLALYGKVERAAKGTQGIMNGAENKLSVSFTFELSGAGETERYRVERQYKRAGETSVHGAICRLVHVRPEGDVVLADKQNEVDAEVARLIGLEMPDFTRAVVLPQGKFAEFLSLAGKERRQMLQRLFRLERYGDMLAARLSARSDKVKLELKETEAEQQGLGDASPEALQAAAARLAELREAAAGLRVRLTEAETSHAELGRRKERQEELQRIENELSVLTRRAEEMVERERRLDRLNRAAGLEAVLRDADEARDAAASANAAKREAEQRLSVHTAEARRTADESQRLGEEAARREPELLVRLERLEQALQLELETEELARQQAGLAEQLARLEQESVRIAAAVTEQQDLLERGKSRQAALKEQLAALLPAAELSVRLQTAAAKRQQWASLTAQVTDAAKEARETSDRVEMAEARCRQTEAGAADYYREGLMLQAWWNGVSAELEKLREEAAAYSAESASAAERLREWERGREREQLAHLLADSLTDGQPCPVCGSTSHPHPGMRAVPVDGEQAVSNETKAVADAGQRIALLQQEFKSWMERSVWYRNRLTDKLKDSDFDITTDVEALQQAAPSVPPAEAAQDLQEWSGRCSDWLASLSELSQRHDRWESAFSDRLREWAQAKDAVLSCTETSRQAENRRLKAAEQADSFAKAWTSEFPDLAPEQIHAKAEEAAAADREVRDIRERLDKSVGFLEQQELKFREAEREGHELSLRLAETKARKESADALLANAAGRLSERTGGGSASALLAASKQELEQLRTACAEAKAAAENAERHRQESLRQLDTAAERDQAAAAAMERTFKRLADGLNTALFESAEQVRSLLPELPNVPALKQEIEAYRRMESQLTAQRELLRERMTGEPVTPDAWEQSLSVLDSIRRESEEALALTAKAERDVDDLSARRGRWEELERKRAALSAEASRIAQLQSVFRGNAFVEYIAEEQLEQVCVAASERLGFLTRRRYALEVDASGGFVIRDDANGGLRRPVSTLSGGETFLTSLALALALSAQIQLRGKYPLQFFFLDEGFGTLDPELLETVITSLEKLQHSRLAVGIISHVPELQARLPRRLHVTPAEPGGRGSRITYETM
ncbi:SMC family ATPase [Cohnella pontilimi]|uniref:Nuclease SbcCD subunit C n=1 Tax=Cohnella pontilimi TaxID=2564100 RepID=A0A4U0FGC0_9BACL|nr:AAA family ATPase [Cohnella pontilimi]TJY43434.1 SMC family ATPase [Cohnella pontilimi]